MAKGKLVLKVTPTPGAGSWLLWIFGTKFCPDFHSLGLLWKTVVRAVVGLFM